MGNAWRSFRDPRLPGNYFRIQVNMLRWLGLELMNEESAIYRVYSKTFLFFVVFFFTAVEMYEVCAQWGNLDIVIGICSFLITHITGIIKTCLLFWNRKRFGDIIRALHSPPFAPDETRGGDVEERLIRNVVYKTEIQIIVFFALCIGGLTSGAANAIYVRYAKAPEEWVFPYAPTITVVDLSYSPMFDVGVAYQIFNVTAFAGIIATTYVLLSVILAHISVQLKILGNSMRNLRPRAIKMQEADVNKDRPLSHYMNQAMKSSIEHHLQTLDLAMDMEELCSLMILAVFLCSVILLCFILYFTSLFTVGSFRFFENFFYSWIIVCQVGMYCYWGNEVSLEAERVAQAAVECDWLDAPGDVAKAVVMVAARAQRPLNITAGKFVPLSMTTFMSIIKGSFSYFMILRQTQEEA